VCGITGFCDFTLSSSEEILFGMTNELVHRGPDDAGIDFREDVAQVGLGHRRLSILDLSSAGHQPMVSFCNKFVIAYNGEIYNYKEIASELQNLGVKFKSSTDTEVILEAFKKWGVHSVDRFRGMFAYVIYDLEKQQLFAFRDRAGVKPFFFYFNEGLFLFSSEMKALHCHPGFRTEISNRALAWYFQLGYVPAPLSIFQHTKKLLPGHFLKLEINSKKLSINKYWDIYDYFSRPKLTLSLQEAAEQLEVLFEESFEYRMVSDVPVGIFLSGGYDSSMVTSLLQKKRSEKLKTFTIGFEDNDLDEAPVAKQIADYLGTDHTEYYCSNHDASNIVPLLSKFYDEPMADPSSIPTFLVSKIAGGDVKVVLSADGGDEHFAGYARYEAYLDKVNTLKQYPAWKKISLNFLNKGFKHIGLNGQIRNKISVGYGILNQNSIQNYTTLVSKHLSDTRVKSLLNLNFLDISDTYFDQQNFISGECDPLDQMLALDYKTYLCDNILVKLDRATMAVGIEGREPLLDHKISEFVAQLPSSYKYYQSTSKYLIKQITHKYIPKRLLDRPKQGFSPPINKWLFNDFKAELDELSSQDYLDQQGIFNQQLIQQIKNKAYKEGHYLYVRIMWSFFVFQLWYQQWMEK